MIIMVKAVKECAGLMMASALIVAMKPVGQYNRNRENPGVLVDFLTTHLPSGVSGSKAAVVSSCNTIDAEIIRHDTQRENRRVAEGAAKQRIRIQLNSRLPVLSWVGSPWQHHIFYARAIDVMKAY
jgi:hypothetical protein